MSGRSLDVKRSGVGRAFVWMLVGVLTAGLPGTGLAQAASRAKANLTVVSAPRGASVYVDGRLRGRTPLTLDNVAAGKRRVKIIKKGYLASSRTVTVRSGKAASLRIDMTPNDETQIRRSRDMDRTRESGGSKKLLYVGGAIAGAAAVTYLAVKGGNKAPTVAGVSVDPANAVGIPSVTEFRFTAQGAADSDGDALKITWDFGDGSSATGESVTHVYSSEGAYPVEVSVSDEKSQVTATASVTVRSLGGAWSTMVGSDSYTTNLTQSGTRLSGRFVMGHYYDTLNGTVSPPRNVVFRLDYLGIQFAGIVSDSGDRITGTARGSGGSATFTMTR
ncbi:MAG: PEGA domain-containing protein [Vicinamibacteria bacterium]|nr:PEGA domain-containing protein [Vicinamibacteria bacterium]